MSKTNGHTPPIRRTNRIIKPRKPEENILDWDDDDDFWMMPNTLAPAPAESSWDDDDDDDDEPDKAPPAETDSKDDAAADWAYLGQLADDGDEDAETQLTEEAKSQGLDPDEYSNWSDLGTVLAASGPQEWPEIDPLDAVILPEFPVKALPNVLRRWVQAESRATQTPPDLAGLVSLAVVSATIAKRVVVQPRPGWIEPANLFVAVLLDPSNRKSAVFADAINPLGEIEAEQLEAARPNVAHKQSERRRLEAKLKGLEKKAAAGDDDADCGKIHSLAAKLATTPEPVLPRRIVDDATAEKLAMMLNDHGGRIASFSPEGGVFDLMAGRYSKGTPQFEVYLKAHSGDDLRTDRVTRDSLIVPKPALTCAYAVQPSVIARLAENKVFRERGLLGRFLYADPKSKIGHREIAPTPMGPKTKNAYRKLIRKLAAELEGETILELTDEAQARLIEWESEIEAMLGDGGEMEAIRDWGGKLAGATLRLAAAIHCAKQGTAEGRISVQTVSSAIEIAKYLIPHAERVLSLAGASRDDADAAYVLAWIRRHDKQEFGKREAQQQGKRRFPRADDIDPALESLAQRGYIRIVQPQEYKSGRPPAPRYEVNPALSKLK